MFSVSLLVCLHDVCQDNYAVTHDHFYLSFKDSVH